MITISKAPVIRREPPAVIPSALHPRFWILIDSAGALVVHESGAAERATVELNMGGIASAPLIAQEINR